MSVTSRLGFFQACTLFSADFHSVTICIHNTIRNAITNSQGLQFVNLDKIICGVPFNKVHETISGYVLTVFFMCSMFLLYHMNAVWPTFVDSAIFPQHAFIFVTTCVVMTWLILLFKISVDVLDDITCMTGTIVLLMYFLSPILDRP